MSSTIENITNKSSRYAFSNNRVSKGAIKCRDSNTFVTLFFFVAALFLMVQKNVLADTAPLAVRDTVFKSIGRAQSDIAEQRFDKAIEQLDKTLKNSTNSQEKALILNALGYCRYIQDRHNDAIIFYAKALKLSPISNGLQLELLLTIGQLYFSTEQYSQSIRSLEKALKMTTKKDFTPHIILGQAYLRTGYYRKALSQTKIAMDMADKRGIAPKEQWLALLKTVYLELDEMTALAAVLEKLVKRFPRKKHWLHLASVYASLDETQKQLTTLEIAYQQNIFTHSKEYIYLAHLYLQADIPYKAARLLDQEIKSGRINKTDKHLFLESQSWLLAQEFEKSIPPLQAAAKLSAGGNYYIQLGQIYMSLEQWKNASAAFINGLRKGGLKRPDNAFLALGTALFYQGALEAARDAFAEAREDERSIKVAKQWIDYINSTLDFPRP